MGRTHQLACSRRRSLLQFRTYEPSWTVDRSSIFIRFLRGLQTAPTVARCCRLFYGVTGYNDSQYGRSRYLFRPRRRSPQHEGGAGELYCGSQIPSVTNAIEISDMRKGTGGWVTKATGK